MRLIDADELRRQVYTCRETTDAFLELIDEMPTVESSSEKIRLLMHVDSEISDQTTTLEDELISERTIAFAMGVAKARAVIRRTIMELKHNG